MTDDAETRVWAKLAPSWAYLSMMGCGALLCGGVAATQAGWLATYNWWVSGLSAGVFTVMATMKWVAHRKLTRAPQAAPADEERKWNALLVGGPRRPF